MSDQWISGKNHDSFWKSLVLKFWNYQFPKGVFEENFWSWNFEITHFLRGFSKKNLGFGYLELLISEGVFWENDTKFTTFWIENQLKIRIASVDHNFEKRPKIKKVSGLPKEIFPRPHRGTNARCKWDTFWKRVPKKNLSGT